MIQIDMEMPEYCARCPLLVVHKGEDFMPTYLCKLKWKELDHEYICKNRAEICPIKEHDYRSWMIDMLHKYGRDDLIAIMVKKGEENILADMLKEQEAVKPTWQQGKAYCGSCGKRIPLKIGARYCHKCGKPIMWEGR